MNFSSEHTFERTTEHDAVWEKLPWYLNGTLEEADADAVREHLIRCVACREEAREQEVIRKHILEADSRPERAPEAFMNLVERIDQDAVPSGRSARTFARSFARSSAPSSAPSSTWSLPLRLAALLVVAAGIWVVATVLRPAPAADPEVNSFVVLADPAACTGDLSVVFDPTATETAIRELLLAEHLEIACGPTAERLYKLRVVDTDGAAALESAARLREQKIVKLALVSGAR